jgi:hypothetical protein
MEELATHKQMFLPFHSQHASDQIGYHQVIRVEYTNVDGINIQLQC